MMLVSGEGGQGKTRLARQFAAQTRQAGWAAGFLAARTLVQCLAIAAINYRPPWNWPGGYGRLPAQCC